MSEGLEHAFEGLQISLQVPDLWQQEAIRKLREGNDVIISAPTGAGKTLVFEEFIDGGKRFSPGKQAVYTVPTRALANDKWREWKQRGWHVGIATGDLAEKLDAPVLVATLETQRERLLSGDGPSLLVIDEYQMIADRARGLHYELAIALAPAGTQLLLLSGSVGNPSKVADWLSRLGRRATLVETKERPVPLDEISIEALPRSTPRNCRNFWQRLGASVLLSKHGPLLIFATHRKAAEKIAFKVAEVLPDDQPISFDDPELQQACSSNLTRLLRKRVAFHHSGLGFAERAAIVEPLAKAGQLRVIVATMGLAAGINFSVRSVFVADRQYQDGPFQREVAPDELLQMFGRAGRRGLDETGFVIAGDRTPRLYDAHSLELRRQNELDWPTLIRRMHFAAEAEGEPVEAARELRDRLFSRQKIALGFQAAAETEEAESKPLFGLKPFRREVLNAEGEWERVRPGQNSECPLGEAKSFHRGDYIPAESNPSLLQSLLPPRMRICRLRDATAGLRRYGAEAAVATEVGPDRFALTKAVRKILQSERAESVYSFDEARSLLPDALADSIAPARYESLEQRGKNLFLATNLSSVEVEVYLDSNGIALH
ncbi:MAG: DEAD/DEAH box helicase, partial [Verrucomicrobiota bacterium]